MAIAIAVETQPALNSNASSKIRPIPNEAIAETTRPEHNTEHADHECFAFDRLDDETFRCTERFEDADLFAAFGDGRVHREQDEDRADERTEADEHS